LPCERQLGELVPELLRLKCVEMDLICYRDSRQRDSYAARAGSICCHDLDRRDFDLRLVRCDAGRRSQEVDRRARRRCDDAMAVSSVGTGIECSS
jgi:hypothetical protein